MKKILQDNSLSNLQSLIASILNRPLIPIICILIFQGLRGVSPFDDAYITYRYARNISQGLGFVYNHGEAVLGTTTPLFTLLLAAISRLLGPESIPNASFYISLIADAINVWLIYRLALWAFNRWEIAFMASMIFALQPFRIDVATGGMETSIVLTLLLFSYERFLIANKLYVSLVIASFALLTRPDAIVAFVPMLLFILLRERESFLKGLTLLILVIAPWIIWATITFGSPLPHSITAKATTYEYPVAFASYFILTFIGTGTLGPYLHLVPVLLSSIIIILVILIGNVFLVRFRMPVLIITSYPLVYGSILAAINAPMYFPWYYPPLMPGLIFSLIAAIWYLPKLKSGSKRVTAVLLGVLLVSVPALLLTVNKEWPLSRESAAFYKEACEIVKPELEPLDTVLAPDIGLLGWCLEDTTIVDPIGLVTPISLRFSDTLRPGELISPELIQETRPEYVIALDQYLEPYLFDEPGFVNQYTLFWEQEVSNSGIQQTLFVFARK